MECTWLEYLGVTGPENVRNGTDRGDGVIGSLVCEGRVIEITDGCVESVIHAIIAATPALYECLPPDLWITGTYNGESPVYCTINRDGGSPQVRTNGVRLDDVDIRFDIWTPDHPQGSKIQKTIVEVFDNLSTDLTLQNDEFSILYTRVQNSFAVQETDRTWHFLTDIKFWSDKQ